ncbi:hypothetical protein Ancab_006920 [Ancistrocladus abbreviatus]
MVDRPLVALGVQIAIGVVLDEPLEAGAAQAKLKVAVGRGSASLVCFNLYTREIWSISSSTLTIDASLGLFSPCALTKSLICLSTTREAQVLAGSRDWSWEDPLVRAEYLQYDE